MIRQPYQFRTKTGFCSITDTNVRLTRTGIGGEVANVVTGKSIQRILAIYTVLAIAMLSLSILLFLRNFSVIGFALTVVGAIFLLGAWRSRDCSVSPIIDRNLIRKVTVHKPQPPFTRGYFTVFFEEQGKTRRRLIMLPGSRHGGTEEYEMAFNIFVRTGLL